MKRLTIRVLVWRSGVVASNSLGDLKDAAKTDLVAGFSRKGVVQLNGLPDFVDGFHLLLVWTLGDETVLNTDIQTSLKLHYYAPRFSGGSVIEAAFAFSASCDSRTLSHFEIIANQEWE